MAKRKKTKKSSRKVEQKKKFKINPVLIAAIAIVLVLAAAYYFNAPAAQNNPKIESGNQQTTIGPQASQPSVGGNCERNNECFVTYCKGEERSCVNVTELSGYSKKCRTYLDWVVSRQDSSTCSCVNNVCTMLK
jgi:hypothetical protein